MASRWLCTTGVALVLVACGAPTFTASTPRDGGDLDSAASGDGGDGGAQDGAGKSDGASTPDGSGGPALECPGVPAGCSSRVCCVWPTDSGYAGSCGKAGTDPSVACPNRPPMATGSRPVILHCGQSSDCGNKATDVCCIGKDPNGEIRSDCGSVACVPPAGGSGAQLCQSPGECKAGAGQCGSTQISTWDLPSSGPHYGTCGDRSS